jgi:hypothetical protein
VKNRQSLRAELQLPVRRRFQLVGGATDVDRLEYYNFEHVSTHVLLSMDGSLAHVIDHITRRCAGGIVSIGPDVSGTVTAPGGTHLRSKRKKLAPTVPSEVLVLYVLGSQGGCGKSSLLHLLGDSLMDPKEYGTHVASRNKYSSPDYGTSKKRQQRKKRKRL